MASNPPSSNKHQFAEIEEEILALWEQEGTFAASLQQREGAERFSFFDGPPYANGLPHHGHVVPSLVKDAITRYKTMRGYYVPRRAGWDCHGLPVEQKIEKELGFNSRQEIEDYGIAKFNQACRDSVLRYKAEWEQFITRLGRWVDLKNAYTTMEESYIESIWWVFKQIWDKGLVYEDFKSMPYCPRCATPLANFEVSQGYQDGVEDPSIYVKFQLEDDEAALLAWTTTPWTLPGNAALAVKPNAKYVRVRHNQEVLILAAKCLEVLRGEYHQEAEFTGRELLGKRYTPLFELDKEAYELGANAYRVQAADFVNLKEGTGVVHIAPAFGADDLELGQTQALPVLQTVDNQGFIKAGVGLKAIEGKFFKDADEPIIRYLGAALLHSEVIQHTYPFCWRCDSPLMYYAVTTWFIRTDPKQLVKHNEAINWVPAHVKHGRFGKWLEGARDWSFSRNRYWGAPLPIWRTESGETVVVGSVEELKKLALNPEAVGDLHRPQIDKVKLKTPSGEVAARIEEVFDVWFESGAVPYASNHYPFENKAEFEDSFPADFIAEAIDQTRGWFYTLHVEAASLFDSPAFRNVVVGGWVVAADGQKLSKKLKNYTPIEEVFERYGADALRYFIATSPVVNGEDVAFRTDSLRDVQRNVFGTLWNTYNFFRTYADVDKWRPPSTVDAPQSQHVLDRWIVSRLEETVAAVTKQADRYQVMKAALPLRELIDDLSNWYVRRSRRRFWKSEDDSDKQQAYATLWYVLIRTCQLMAPFAPFMSEKIYLELRGAKMPPSVHLSNWPAAGEVDQDLLGDMQLVRSVISQGLDQRAQAGIKVRQPLLMLEIRHQNAAQLAKYEDIIKEEVNVKTVSFNSQTANESDEGREEWHVDLDTNLAPELKREGYMRDIVRHVQQLRKESGLAVDDRIVLNLKTAAPELKQAIKEHGDAIATETLAKSLNEKSGPKHSSEVEIDAQALIIELEKTAK